MTNAATTTQCNPLFRVAFVGADVSLDISTIAILGPEIRDISVIRGSESVDSCLLVSIRG